jgi:hypothetical protein
MRQLGRELGKSVDGLYPIDSGRRGSNAERTMIAKLERTHAVVEEVLASLLRIVPPPRIETEHRRLERGVRGIAAEIEAVIRGLQTGDLASTITPSGLPSLSIITAATDGMERKGFDVLG